MFKDYIPIKVALVSVYDKENIVDFCSFLRSWGVKILSTGKTASLLRQAGIACQEIQEFTQFPEILEGRVKTLHPKVFAGVLAKRDRKSLDVLKKIGSLPIDMVVVNFYPFWEKTKELKELDRLVEFIDIGGPSLVRAGSKNFLNVCVVADKKFYPLVKEEMSKNRGKVSFKLRKRLAIESFKICTIYNYHIFRYLDTLDRKKDFSDYILLGLNKECVLRYGENPHQKGYLYFFDTPVLGDRIQQYQGKQLSFNNILDIDRGIQILKEFKQSCCVIVKHNNPCGVCESASLLESYEKAYRTDPISSFGSIVGFNKRVDEKLAQVILDSGFREIVFAPSFTKKALRVFFKKKNLIVCKVKLRFKDYNFDMKKIEGGVLLQEKDKILFFKNLIKIPTKLKPSSKKVWEDLIFGFKVVKHLKSNAICIVRDKTTLGLAGGEPSRIGAVKLAIQKAGDCKGAILASDAFFPYPDSIEEAHKAGIKYIIQPGGSIRDKEVVSLCDKYGMSLILTGVRHFLH